jgi:hypothetical protein
MSYKEYRPKTRIRAREIEQDIKVRGENGDLVPILKGSYEILGDDGVLTYQAKEPFEAANEPVRQRKEKPPQPARSRPARTRAPAPAANEA